MIPRLTLGVAERGRVDHAAHETLHGPLGETRHRGRGLLEELERAGLRGRGGAGFPTAAKLAAVRAGKGARSLVVNAAEGEPMSAKDAFLLESAPHLVLDGALLAAEVAGASTLLVAVPEDARAAARSLAAALAERPDTQEIETALVPARFIAGEESALLRYLGGGPLRPRLTPPWPAERGLGGKPTLVQNPETLAQLALVARHGASWFRAVGPDVRPGSTLVTVSGAVRRPGVYEIDPRTEVPVVLGLAGGTLEPTRAVLIGGYFGAWLDGAAALGARLDPAALAPLGAALGAGVLVVLGESACPVAELSRAVWWLAGESAGQCGPCVHGLAAIADALVALAEGRADAAAAERIAAWTSLVERRGACRHPDGVARHVRSGLRVFATELEDHRLHGPCAACSAPPVLAAPVPEAALA